MVNYRDELIDKIAVRLLLEECLNTHDYNTTDDLLDAVREVITEEMKGVALVRGEVLE